MELARGFEFELGRSATDLFAGVIALAAIVAFAASYWALSGQITGCLGMPRNPFVLGKKRKVG